MILVPLKEKIFLTVAIFVHNRDEFVNYALNSVLGQTLDRSFFEILIISNIYINLRPEQLNIPNLKIIQTDQQSLWDKIVLARNLANGEIISFLEDDDLWHSNKLKHVMEVFLSDPNICYYHNGFKLFHDQKITETVPSNWDSADSHKSTTIQTNSARDSLKLFADYNLSSISIQKKILFTDLKIMPENLFIDGMLFLLATFSSGPMAADNIALTFIRLHKNNNSGLSIKDERENWFFWSELFQQFNVSGGLNKTLVNFLQNEFSLNAAIRYSLSRFTAFKYFYLYLLSAIRLRIRLRSYVMVKFCLFFISERLMKIFVFKYHTDSYGELI